MRQNENMPKQNEREKNEWYNREISLLYDIMEEQTRDTFNGSDRQKAAKAISHASHNTFCLISAEQFSNSTYYDYLIDGE